MLGTSKAMGKRKAGVTGNSVGMAELKPGSRSWFREMEDLNDHGYIPRVDLPAEIMCKAKVEAMWGKKNVHNGFRYRRHMSNRQARRVRYLY
jgi:hypothetical protein